MANIAKANREMLAAIEAQGRAKSALHKQVGGDHYRTLGDYQPWKVLHATMSPDEFRGYMIGTAQAYLIRNKDNRRQDIEKAMHTLQGWLELTEGEQ